jgi:hypothetical protein
MRAYMRSTYDRCGGNEDASHFLYRLSDDFNVTLDLEGPGLLVFSRYNHCLFYGAGTLYNRDNREYLVKAFPVNIRFTGDRIYLACYFPMPFFRSARIELVGAWPAVDDRFASTNSSISYTEI